jgi:hypothetical protein
VLLLCLKIKIKINTLKGVKILMGNIYFTYSIPENQSTHVIFQPPTTLNGDIIKQLNTTTNDFQKLSYNGTLFTYENNVSGVSRTDTYTINIGTSDYIYFHLVILPTTALFYGIKANTTVDLLKTFSPTSAVASDYDRVYLYGDNRFSYLWTENIIQTQPQIDDTLAYDFKPTSTLNTTCIALFNNNLLAGDIQNLTSPILYWRFYKRKIDDTIDTFVGEIDVTATPSKKILKDYTNAINVNYLYSVAPFTSTQTGSPLTSNSVILDDWRWSLTSTTSKQVVFFELDVQTNAFSNTTDVYEYKGFTQYNKIAQGETDFLKGGLTCTFGTVNDNGEYVATIEQFNALRAFINDKSPKILKGRNGMIGIYHTTMDNKQFEDKTMEQAFKVTINFTEIDDIDSYQVFS